MNNNSSSTRLPIPQYVMTLAHAAALRSEDPYRKVGAAAWVGSLPPACRRCVPMA